jgi:hypothetical protein
VIYFVTICVEDRKPVLANDAAFNAFKNAAVKLREWRVLAGILMPDLRWLHRANATLDSVISLLR